MANYAIGDVHGCLQPLQALLQAVDFDPARDRLWFTGDLVARGPDSGGVLRLVRSLGPAAEAVLGNHDLHLLRLIENDSAQETPDWVRQLLDQPDGAQLLDWLAGRPTFVRGQVSGDGGGRTPWLLTHAGVHPDWTLSLLEQLDRQIAEALERDRRLLLQIALGDSLHWRDELRGLERAGTALGYLTRMRHLRPDGSLDPDHPSSGVGAGRRGWFEHRLRILTDEPDSLLLFGHWAALNGHTGHDRILALDTGAVWGNRLSAVRLEDGRRFSVPGWLGGAAA